MSKRLEGEIEETLEGLRELWEDNKLFFSLFPYYHREIRY